MTVFDDDELESIKSLRERVKPWAEKTKNEYALSYLDDDTLWRYCLAHKYKLDDSEKMFKESTVFKNDWDMDNIYSAFWGNEQYDIKEAKQEMKPISREVQIGKQVFYAGFLKKKSFNGGPVIVERLGKVDFAGLSGNKEAKEACLKAYVVNYERMWRSLRSSKDKQMGIAIVDMSGISFSALKYMSLIREVSALSVANYPEMVEKVVLVKAPRSVSILWKAIRPFIPERTKQKVSIVGDDFMKVVEPLIEGGRASLPKFLGGDADDSTICPAEKVCNVAQLKECASRIS